jgi:L-lactate dehydrogenase
MSKHIGARKAYRVKGKKMKIGIIGAGFVGSTAAYAMVMRGVGSEIILVDLNHERAVAEAQDIAHAAPFAYPVQIRAGGYEDLSGADLIILAAGVNQKPGETRLDLLARNKAVFEVVVGASMAVAPRALYLVATNPVDVMTQVTTRLSGLSARQVIGSGTVLDTARFRSLLGTHLALSPKSVHSFVVGEHGDSEVLCWSSATAGTLPLLQLAQECERPINAEIKASIDHGVRRAAGHIIAGKGATYYGIGAGLARIAQAIQNDERAILTVSACTDSVGGEREVALSLPRVIGRAGILDTLSPSLDKEEAEALAKSAHILKTAANAIGV